MQAKLHLSTALNEIVVPSKASGGNFECTTTNNCNPGAVSLCGANQDFGSYNLNYFDKTTNQVAVLPFLADANNCHLDQTFIRWTDSNIDKPEAMVTNLQVYSFEKSNDNLGESVGLIGLAPNGKLLDYILNKTEWNDKEDSMQLSLSYSPNTGASKLMDTTNTDTWKQNQFIIKGKRNGGDITFESDLVGDKATWTIGNATFNISDDNKDRNKYTPVANVPLCLASDYPYMVGLVNSDSSAQVLSYYNSACPSAAADNCKESDYKKSDVKKASIQLANNASDKATDYKKYDLNFETDDILYFNDKNFRPLVGQPVAAADLAKWGCYETTQIVVGRPFLAKYEAVMKVYNKDSKKTLAFIPNEGTSSIFLII